MTPAMANFPDTSTIEIDADVLDLIAEIDEFRGTWQAVRRIVPERLSWLRRIATIESVGSSTRIEGARLSDEEVERLLSRLEVTSFASRDHEEVAGYARVLETIFDHYADLEITENHVLQLHRDLLRHSTKDERHRGRYKTLPNHVEARAPDGESLGVVFETATPFDTPARMADLIAWHHDVSENDRLHSLLVIGVFVVVFLEVHPFQDGNGRLSRVLTTLLLLRSGYEFIPYASFEQIIENQKRDYYLALRRTQRTLRTDRPDWQPWLTFFLHALRAQKRNVETKLEHEKVMAEMPDLSARVLAFARDHGRVTIATITKATDANRNTVKDHVAALTRQGHLVRRGRGRGTWYTLG